MTTEVWPHEPRFKKIDTLSRLIAVATNPHLFWQGLGESMDLPELEQRVLPEVLKNELEKLLRKR